MCVSKGACFCWPSAAANDVACIFLSFVTSAEEAGACSDDIRRRYRGFLVYGGWIGGVYLSSVSTLIVVGVKMLAIFRSPTSYANSRLMPNECKCQNSKTTGQSPTQYETVETF